MIDRIKALFAAPTPEPSPRQIPAALLTQQALDQLLDLLGQYHEPDKLLQQLGKPRSELRKLLADDEISAALETRRAAVLSTDWHIDPNGAGARVAKFITAEMDTHLADILRSAWSAVPFGHSVIEAVYRMDGSAVRLGRIAAPPFEWFRPQQDGSLRFYPSYGDSTGYGELVDTASKFFVTTRNPTVTNPHGEALLATLYWPWYFRTSGWEFWARYLERHGSPVLVGKTLGDTTAMAAALDSAIQSAVIAIGREDDVAAITAPSSSDSFQAFSDAVDRRIQKVVLGQTLTSDVGNGGSYAAASVHNEVRMDRRIGDCALVAATVNRIIQSLVQLNFGAAATAPRFVMEDGRGLDSARAERDKLLADAGIVRFTQSYIVNNYDLGEGDFEIPQQPASTQPAQPAGGPVPPAAPAQAALAGGPLAFAAKGATPFTPQQQALETLADELLDKAPPVLSLAQIRAAIEQAEDRDDLATRLSRLLPDSDAGQFRQVLERALFAADVMGYVAAEEQQP